MRGISLEHHKRNWLQYVPWWPKRSTCVLKGWCEIVVNLCTFVPFACISCSKLKHLKFKDIFNKMCLWHVSCVNVAGTKDKYILKRSRSCPLGTLHLHRQPDKSQKKNEPTFPVVVGGVGVFQLEWPWSAGEALAVSARVQNGFAVSTLLAKLLT